ncbi:hypothetical protein FACS189496_4070 [Bacilli bacterium]|nr:hypothetical protein FACS189496_4070 [Bacilli bacterium]
MDIGKTNEMKGHKFNNKPVDAFSPLLSELTNNSHTLTKVYLYLP